MAEVMAKRFMAESSAPVAEAATLTEEAALETPALFTKIRFSWRPEDRAILERIRASAESMFAEAFEAAISAIDHFYLQLRVPRHRDGIVLMGADGRPVWETENGRPVERWDQLTGQDVEYTLANLERVKLAVAPRVNQLLLEAMWAKNVSADIHDEAYTKVMEDTVPGRTARANKESREDRYHAFFRFYLYSTAKTFLDEIDNFMKLLTNIRYWQVRGMSR